MRRTSGLLVGVLSWLSAWPAPVVAQPWDVFVDPVTGEACDLVNGSNVEFVVFTDTGELVIVTGVDVFLGDTFVDANGDVFFDGEPFGFIAFEEDGNFLPSLFWLTDFGTVVGMDLEFFVPFDSQLLPGEFVNVPCDACPFWDDSLDCEDIIFDGDDDGVPDEDDLCPDTGPGEIVDDDGCSCEDIGDCDCFIDTDDDDVADCDDECPNTGPGEFVDDDGCSCEDIGNCDCFIDTDDDGVVDCDDDCPDTGPGENADDGGCSCEDLDECDGDGDGDGDGGGVFVNCGNVGALMLAMTFMGLGVMRFSYGRRSDLGRKVA